MLSGLPRTRGDGPAGRLSPGCWRTASPHTRGWTRIIQHGSRSLQGFPAHAGITGRARNADRDRPMEVCSFRLPKVCSFQLPLTQAPYREARAVHRRRPARLAGSGRGMAPAPVGQGQSALPPGVRRRGRQFHAARPRSAGRRAGRPLRPAGVDVPVDERRSAAKRPTAGLSVVSEGIRRVRGESLYCQPGRDRHGGPGPPKIASNAAPPDGQSSG